MPLGTGIKVLLDIMVLLGTGVVSAGVTVMLGTGITVLLGAADTVMVTVTVTAAMVQL